MAKSKRKPRRRASGREATTRPARASRGPVTRKPAARTPARRFKPGRPLGEPRKLLITSFRAEGSIGSLASVIYGGVREGEGVRYEKKQRRYLELQSSSPKGFPDSPGVWTSLEGFALGQVNFPGRVSKETLFKMLNRGLNLVDKRGRLADFRRVYKNWKWKWQIVEVLTVPKNRAKAFKEARDGKVKRIIQRDSGNSRNRI